MENIGIEPMASRIGTWRSASELIPLAGRIIHNILSIEDSKSLRQESNLRPEYYKYPALPLSYSGNTGTEGLEPPINDLEGRGIIHYATCPGDLLSITGLRIEVKSFFFLLLEY